ncbi:IS110 family RNA-guided transposase [Spirosoma utsteinense]|uniref:IS110 family transposase n=1 Tax=Spirosoma utsteinense TaxID=2585773 RepID=UPI0016462E74|nr:IS110 family transposase [Spirosoma utsteinense]MBC3787150.1 transposase [Spirosoma utsteinense]
MPFDFFLGIDVAKQTLDYAFIDQQGNLKAQGQIPNAQRPIELLLEELHQRFNMEPVTTLICLEHTGIYSNHLLEVLTRPDYRVWLESGKQIRYSMRVHRVKTDSADALNIVRYAQRHQAQARLWKPEPKLLTSLRSRLLLAVNTLKQPLKEAKPFVDKGIVRSLEKASANSLKALEKDLEAVNCQIETLIKRDPELNRLFHLLTSIVGIGAVTATSLILATKAFTDGKTAKQFACYAGVAPFPYQSGSSIRGRTRVSPMADKHMKTLLHLSAITAIRAKGEVQDYYQQKVKEGKNKMAVLNAVRNKLILRAYAVVSKNQEYDKTYTYTLA